MRLFDELLLLLILRILLYKQIKGENYVFTSYLFLLFFLCVDCKHFCWISDNLSRYKIQLFIIIAKIHFIIIYFFSSIRKANKFHFSPIKSSWVDFSSIFVHYFDWKFCFLLSTPRNETMNENKNFVIYSFDLNFSPEKSSHLQIFMSHKL